MRSCDFCWRGSADGVDIGFCSTCGKYLCDHCLHEDKDGRPHCPSCYRDLPFWKRYWTNSQRTKKEGSDHGAA